MEREEQICVIVIVIIVAAIVGYFAYDYVRDRRASEEAEEERSRLFVEEGDTISFEVTGWLDDGRIFYTTDKSIADDESRFKSANFIFYSDEADVYVVGEELTSRFNQGFTDNVNNMKIDEMKTFKVNPDNGYGWPNETLIKKIPLADSIPLFVEQSRIDFQIAYNPDDIQIAIGQVFEHNYWKWPIEVVEVSDDTVKYRHGPSLNHEITVLPWPAEVTGISDKDNKVFIQHNADQDLLFESLDPLELSEYDEGYIEIQEIQGELEIGNLEGVITSIDANHITIDFNDERAGEFIFYEVEIIDITKA
jgi:FKBP-type peptidyl-prolyl cis-trans isomerase 2